MVLAGYRAHGPRVDLIMAATLVLVEVAFMRVWGLPDYPQGFYGTFFLGCVIVFLTGQFLATASLPQVFYARAGRASRVVCDGVLRVGHKGWSLVSDIYDRVWCAST